MHLSSKRRNLLVLAAALVAHPHFARADAFQSPNDLLLLQSNGDGSLAPVPGANSISPLAALAYTADSVTVNEYNPATLASGVPVNTINLPTHSLSYNGNNDLSLTLPNVSDHDGQLTLSQDGHQLVFGTYLSVIGGIAYGTLDDGSPNYVAPNSAPASLVPRVVTVVHPNGTLDYSTQLTGTNDYPALSLRQVSSLDGTQFWMIGNGDKPYGGPTTADIGGIRFTQLGNSTSVSKNIANGIDARTLSIFQGQMYVAGGSNNSPPGEHTLSQLGTGLPYTTPTWSPLTVTGSGGYSNHTILGNQSPVFLQLNDGAIVVYESDSTTGAIEKWSLTNGSWVFDGRIIYNKDNIENIAARVQGNSIDLYADNTLNLYHFTDTGGAGFMNISGLTNTSLPGNPSTYPFSQLVPVLTSNGPSFRGLSFAPSASAAVGNQIWGSASGGSWGTSGNWVDGIPNASGATATFGPSSPGLSSSGAVNLDTNRTVGHIVLNNASSSYTLAPGTGGSLTIDNTDPNASGVPSIFVTSGNHTISAPISLVHGVTISSAYQSGLAISAPVSGSGDVSAYGIGVVGGSVTLPMTGTLTLSGSSNYSGNTFINSGQTTVTSTGSLPVTTNLTVGDAATDPAALIFNASTGTSIRPIPLGSVTILKNAKVTLSQSTNHSGRSVLVTGGLTFTGSTNAWQGLLDVTGNDIIVRNGITSDIFNQLKAGFNAHVGYWNGASGITSSAAAADTRHLTAVGFRPSDGNTFDGVNTTNRDVLLKYTYYGDANLDGVLNGADYQQIDNGFGIHATGWSNGDFNYDGVVDGSDYSLIDNTFNQITATGALPLALNSQTSVRIGSEAAGSLVPEPTSLGMLSIAAIGLLRRRGRRNT